MRQAFPCGIREAVRRGTTPPGPVRPCPADTVSPCCRQAPHGDDSDSSIANILWTTNRFYGQIFRPVPTGDAYPARVNNSGEIME